MTNSINTLEDTQQEQFEAERFELFRFQGRLRNGLKSRIKSHGCQWSHLYHGWICPMSKTKEIEQVVSKAKLDYEHRTVSLPKGMVNCDPKIASHNTRLEILEEAVYRNDRQLLEDVYRYDPSLRPQDFSTPPLEQGKTVIQIQSEHDFYTRWVELDRKKHEIKNLRKELSCLAEEPGDKIFDHHAPLRIAEALIEEHYLYERDCTLHYCSDSFWHWNGTKYVELEEHSIRQSIYTFLRDAKELASVGHLEDFNPTKHKVDQIIDALRAIRYLKHHPVRGSIWIDARETPDPKYLISFRNGLLSIRDWLTDPSVQLISHTPLLLNVNSLEFDFNPDAPVPTAWLDFLDAIWENDLESLELLQEWCGYVLIQDTSQHKILLIVGPPRSGKGTIGKIFRELLGHFNVVGPTLSSLGGEFGLQPLLNKMLALVSDARLNATGNNSIIIERLLSISGEDPLTINRKFQHPLTTLLPTRIMMMSNELPDMRDSSGALAKRYLVLNLKKSWLGKEDISLFTHLKQELPGILLWAFKGLVRLEQRGHFLHPLSSQQTIEELEAMTSPIKAFISDRCIISSLARASVSELFNAWREWCTVNGHQKPGNVQSFGKNLRAAFPEIHMDRIKEDQHRERCYVGIKLH